ncbi:MAG: AIPR family protein [Deltaproteobacteria bacterium]|nr:AIPR family protein [Deltaproteobacteria bacterium]
MSLLHVRHIKSEIERRFEGRIDIADMDGRPGSERDLSFLTRGLAAYALTQIADIDVDRAADAVVDGFDDNGIDAIYYDPSNRIVYVVQSKWIQAGNASPELGDIQKFIQGFKDLIEAKFDRFNDKVRKKEQQILDALGDARAKFMLLTVYTGTQHLSDHAKRNFKDLLDDMNDPTETVTQAVLTQKELHRFVSGHAEGDPIDFEVVLHDWGQIREPFVAYYGQVDAVSVAEWSEQYGSRLFSRNLRKFMENTEVNQAITETLAISPEKFWYFNNGITVLCTRLSKKPLGGAERGSGIFECEGVSVVNGAQTVGSIREAWAKNPETVKTARVFVRFISLENCPEGFATEVTRATNTQNRIERRDFVALDPEQYRLKTELWLECKKDYAYKSGDPTPRPQDGCSIDEATVALACATSDVGLAVQAKREIGKLWENIEKPPYKLLFSQSTSAMRLWRSVGILRVVETGLKEEEKKLQGRARTIAIHGNRFLLYRVFRGLPIDQFDLVDVDLEALKSRAKELVPLELSNIITAVETLYPSSYVHSLFKNVTKCKEIADNMAK